jgi:Spy/CpxP family protein refolding chaperone
MTTNPQTRSRFLAAAVIAIALIVGGLAGATLDRAVIRQTTPGPHPVLQPVSGPMADPGDMPGLEEHRERMRGQGGRAPDMQMRPAPRSLDRLTRELDLSADQRARIEALLYDQQERMRGLRHEHRERRGAIVTETRAGIFELLTPEQRTRLQRVDRSQTRALGPVGRMLREGRGD